MPTVSVTPSYLQGLAQHQDEAATAFSAAASAVSGMAHKVSASHGVVCDRSKPALRNAEDAHNRLAAAMQKYANDLASWLRSAAYAYESNDDAIAQTMRRQMT